MSVVPAPDLRARHRIATIIAIAMIAAVATYWALVEFLDRRRVIKAHPLAGETVVGYGALALGIIVVVAAAAVRRSMLRRGVPDPAMRIQAASIASFAMAESAAVFGLVAFITTGLREAAYPLFVLAFLGLAVYFPRWSQWEEWAREIGAPPTAR